MTVSALLLSTKKFYSKFILCGGWKFSAVFMGDYQVSAVLDRPSNCCHSLPQLVANSLFIPQNKIYTHKLGEIKMAWWVQGMQYFCANWSLIMVFNEWTCLFSECSNYWSSLIKCRTDNLSVMYSAITRSHYSHRGAASNNENNSSLSSDTETIVLNYGLKSCCSYCEYFP